jgi:hypothetical protein
VAAAAGVIERFDPDQGTTVLAPDAEGAGHWVGAPSVLLDPARGTILMAYRRRRPRDGSPGERGYECAIAESLDGVHFTDVWRVRKEDLGTRSMERFCLHRDPDSRYLLYTSYEDPADHRWRIDVMEADAPDAFDLATARPVLTAASTGTDAVKDPYVVRVGPGYFMYVSTFLTDAGPAPTALAVSTDGLRFDWVGEVLPVGTGWDRHQTRLTTVAACGRVFVGLYDGAASAAEDTEERLGVAVSFDLVRWQRLSITEPWLVSPHASGSLRYADVVERGGEWWVYYELARADGSHELRLSRVPVGDYAATPATARSTAASSAESENGFTR